MLRLFSKQTIDKYAVSKIVITRVTTNDEF